MRHNLKKNPESDFLKSKNALEGIYINIQWLYLCILTIIKCRVNMNNRYETTNTIEITVPVPCTAVVGKLCLLFYDDLNSR